MSETPTHFVAVCPNCLVTLKVRLAYSGSHVRCKHCDHKFRAFRPDDMATPGSVEYQSGPLSSSSSEAGRIDVSCPSCSTSMSVPSELAGQHVQCKQCDHKILVPKIEGLPPQTTHKATESDLFDHIYARPEGRPSAEGAAEQRPEPSAEVAALRDEKESLNARLEAIQQDHAAIQAEKDSLLAQLEQLRGEHVHLGSAQVADRNELQRLQNELATLRAALGDLPPQDVAVLNNERQLLADENAKLRGELQTLQAELSYSQEQAQAVADREDELRLARGEADELKKRIAQLEDQFHGVQAAHDRLAEQLRDAQDQASNLEARRRAR